MHTGICVLSFAALAVGQVPISIQRDGMTSNMVAQADNVIFKSTDNSVIADIRAIVSSIAAAGSTASANTMAITSVNDTATLAASTAVLASETANLNAQSLANINTQLASQLNFSGAAASLAALQSAMMSMSEQLSEANAAIDALEAGNYAACQSICVNGNCVNASNSSHTAVQCVCNGDYFGPMCDQTNAPTPAPTNMPTSDPTRASITSCAQATTSGTYYILPSGATTGFDAYCLINSGRAWMKIVRWPSNFYTMNAAAVGGDICAQATSSSFCKLSDDQINSVIPQNSDRYYWIDTAGYDPSVYIRTSNVYQDTANSFNVGASPNNANCIGRVNNGLPTPFAGTRFSQTWIDFLHVTDGTYSQGQGCTRFFIGHGATDCYAYTNGVRCIRSGSTCNNHEFVPDWTMYVSAV